MKRRFFYGWVIVAVMTVISGMGMGMAGFNFGLFIKPMGDELGISRQTFGWAISVRQVGAAITGPLFGRIIDRRGSRLVLMGAIVTLLAESGCATQTSWSVVDERRLMGRRCEI